MDGGVGVAFEQPSPASADRGGAHPKFSARNPYSLGLHSSTHVRGAPAEGVQVELPPTPLPSPGQLVGSLLTQTWVRQSPVHWTTVRPRPRSPSGLALGKEKDATVPSLLRP
jgi:hypothetical protein